MGYVTHESRKYYLEENTLIMEDCNIKEISDLEGFENLVNFRDLALDNNEISKIDGLFHLKNLVRLDICSNNLSNKEQLAELKARLIKLKHLET